MLQSIASDRCERNIVIAEVPEPPPRSIRWIVEAALKQLIDNQRIKIDLFDDPETGFKAEGFRGTDGTYYKVTSKHPDHSLIQRIQERMPAIRQKVDSDLKSSTILEIDSSEPSIVRSLPCDIDISEACRPWIDPYGETWL